MMARIFVLTALAAFFSLLSALAETPSAGPPPGQPANQLGQKLPSKNRGARVRAIPPTRESAGQGAGSLSLGNGSQGAAGIQIPLGRKHRPGDEDDDADGAPPVEHEP
jgi:hypothetical protein